ncbi:hypothetical protein ACWFQT_00555 [Cellulosimicrobium cellulans]|uniref:hypothetical protein n=1 Tax=Cellulosimicrobium cellulans TaxID=1710 RepID=UPI00380C5528
MTRDVRVLFLHGIRKGPELNWVDALNDALASRGRSPIKKDDVIAPDYSAELRKGEYADKPVRARRKFDPSDRWDFAGRQALLQRRLASPELQQVNLADFDIAQRAGLKAELFKEAVDFIRADSHGEIIDVVRLAIGSPRGEWVIISHSLGTAVALELLTRLPPGMKVTQLVTVASPLPHVSQFGPFVDRAIEQIDFSRVETWVNVYNVNDVVPGAKGLYSALPLAVNVPVRGPLLDHSVSTCLAEPSVVESLADALYGVRATDVIPRSPAPERGWDRADLLAILKLQMLWRAHHVLSASGEKRVEEAGSRIQRIREIAIDEVEQQYLSAGRSLPVAQLDGDLSERFGKNRVPQGAVAGFLITLLVADPLAPFELDLGKRDTQIRKYVARDFGLLDSHVKLAVESMGEARRQFRELPVRRIATLGGVAAAVVVVAIVAPWAVAAAAPAGLAGGAAALSGLAALGPGGLAGGMALLAAGGASVGGLASAAGSALVKASGSSVRQSAIELMASAHLGQRLSLTDPTHTEWQILASAYAQARNEASIIGELSDRGSSASSEAQGKVDSLRKALDWMNERGLGPLAITA